jgi:hypothetical protein
VISVWRELVANASGAAKMKDREVEIFVVNRNGFALSGMEKL